MRTRSGRGGQLGSMAVPGGSPYGPSMPSGTRILDGDGRVWALLGPTNTGKTHRAIQRMLAHPSGMIGLPLRLLAREVYDRVVALRGESAVALITGEEKITPHAPKYFVCTVEAMPLDRGVSFVAVDEIQLAGDRNRGHVFTDRLLRARGWSETLFLGSGIIAPLLRALIPGIDIEQLPRLSTLSYAGVSRVTSLPKRSAVVAFNAAQVYATAERMRAVHGGAAVVLGSLSPRARNAQVALYQSGDVQHMVFTALRKFDGRGHRDLTAAELAQIAGRAGRHLEDGTFGTTRELGPMPEASVASIQAHDFLPLTRLYYRNSELDFRSGDALLRSLVRRAPHPSLLMVRDEYDHRALEDLLRKPEVRRLVKDPPALAVLWEVCRIPDYRKTRTGHHLEFLATVAAHLLGPMGRLPGDWVAERIVRLDRIEGDIDALMARIAFVRTWTYLSHQRDWIPEASEWQERTRAIEDKLSDALHAALTKRFVDEKAMALVHRPGTIEVNEDGAVVASGVPIGRLVGLSFDGDVPTTNRSLWNGLRRALQPELESRVAALIAARDREIALATDGRLRWRGGPLARIEGTDDLLVPRIRLRRLDMIEADDRRSVQERLDGWLRGQVAALLAPLGRPAAKQLGPAGRGLRFELERGLGSVRCRAVGDLVLGLTDDDRKAFARLDVRIGTETVYVQSLLKARWVKLRAALWCAHTRVQEWPPLPDARTALTVDPQVPPEFYAAAGYALCGGVAVRADVLERLVAWLRRAARGDGPTAPEEPMSWLALGTDALDSVVAAVGYRIKTADDRTVVSKLRPDKGRGRSRHGRRR
jgi:ATP-dependent RNA helicase SUPV3L1/SUV3